MWVVAAAHTLTAILNFIHPRAVRGRFANYAEKCSQLKVQVMALVGDGGPWRHGGL